MYSYLIKNAHIISGTGEPGFVGDVAFEQDVIAEVAPHVTAKAEHTIDAQGLTLTPGFIDIQNHSDSYWQLFDAPSFPSLVMQGYTTVLLGNCGASLAPLIGPGALGAIQKWKELSGLNVNWTTFLEYADELSKRRFGTNVASLVGYATLRRGLLGDEVRSLDGHELATLKRVLEESLQAGAFGLSTGLSYSHELAVSEVELYELAKIVAAHNKLLSIHLRNEGPQIVESVEEALDLAGHAQCNLKISHLKIRGPANWHYFRDVLDRLETAYTRGLKVGFDVYPYDSVWQPLFSYLPKWAIEGGRPELLRHLDDEVQRRKILSYLHDSGSSLSELIIASTAHPLGIEGKTVGAIAKNMGMTSEEAILEIIHKGGSEVLVFDQMLNKEHVTELCDHPLSFIGTDGAGFPQEQERTALKGGKLVHPRCFGTAPRFLAGVLDRESLRLEEAIRKLTFDAAEKIGLTNRGTIAPGNKADVVIFNQSELRDRATYRNPFMHPLGMEYVFVNGHMAVQEGNPADMTGGVFLRK